LLAEEFEALVCDFVDCARPVVVAVSGGSDSMALLLLLHEFLQKKDKAEQLLALTINHNLSFSKENLDIVHSWICHRNISHEVLEWQHPPIRTGIEQKARTARYDLMTAYCSQHGIPDLFVAHHARDQAETLLMHLSRGSGLRGLGGMRPVSVYNGVKIVRPLLTVHPQKLKDALLRFNQPYMTDPDNLSARFERVRWRGVLEQNSDFDVCHMAQSAKNLQKIEAQVEEAAHEFIRRSVYGATFSKQKFLQLMPIVAQAVLRLLLEEVAPRKASSSYRVMEELYDKIKDPSFSGTTVYGCWIRRTRGNMLAITREDRRKPCNGSRP
jgi:tRNA(Ile)-lysidine synthase